MLALQNILKNRILSRSRKVHVVGDGEGEGEAEREARPFSLSSHNLENNFPFFLIFRSSNCVKCGRWVMVSSYQKPIHDPDTQLSMWFMVSTAFQFTKPLDSTECGFWFCLLATFTKPSGLY